MALRRALAIETVALLGTALLVWFACERTDLDLFLSSLVFDRGRGEFSLRHNWWLAVPGHTGLKSVTVAVWLAVVAAALAPLERLRAWRSAARQAASGMLLAALAVLVLRDLNSHSCPWDLAAFGGSAERFPLFGDPPTNPGPGRCLPAAHASSGFALFGIYFALRCSHPRAGRIALAAAWLVGLVAGAVQVARGAHFASHALWTAWVSYAVNLAVCAALAAVRRPTPESPPRRRAR